MRLGFPAAFFTLYLLVQISVPAIQIAHGRTAFRWGMFSESSDRHDIFAVYPDESRESLEQIQRRTGRAKLLRSDVNPGKLLPAYLCSGTPKPVRIVVRDVRTGAEERYPCP
jgi:hypothetical protein